jgi:N-acetylmuramoyl-L-alanine amidase
MISIFSRKKDLKVRQDILRGVYEENLLILGRGRLARSQRRPVASKKILLAAVICLFSLLIDGRNTGTSVLPVEKPARMVTQIPSPPAADVSLESKVKPADLNIMTNDGKVPLSRMLGLGIRRIMIDAGHGGTDSGTIGKMGTMEKDITLDIAKRLRIHLLQSGRYHVQMTREDDSSVPVQKRVALAREAKSDLFISIHVNSLPNKPINAIETYYFGPSGDPKTLRLVEQENAGSEYGLSDFRDVVERLSKTMKLQESKEFAESIQANLFLNSRRHSEDIKNYGVKRAPFAVLLGPEVPSVLAEVSCLSNPEEERELNSESHRENIAGYLAAGIFNYLNKGALKNETKR